ncbi:chemotaxis protein CheB [Desulfobulbus sp.]|uniref:chemotaxis protein CheB n=1 Tax=Desulfobulbus sp. TaxID=895 RepID=UPI0027B95FB3|nr:chemotaxis protein CheB [Desulfobulbus sp.]
MPAKRRKTSAAPPTHFVGIGASAGGLEAIETFFKNMPSKNNLAFVVVQHLSPDYKSLMVELLTKKTEMPVHRAEEGMEVLAGNVYLIPPKKNLTIFNGKLLLNDKEINQGISLPIDIFLRSLAEDQAERTIAIILSGTGSDGTRGVRAIKEFGGMVMVQTEESAKFDGMPRSAISTGVADFILPPEEMPAQLLAYVAHPYVSGEKHADPLLKDADGLTRLFAELRDKTKVDFTYYKPSTITRRIERRMSVNQIGDFEEYVRYLKNYPGEVMSLYRDLLIGVTNFFRDPEAMAELEERWLPELFLRVKNREIRFWVAGCSTGEEAYTIAILAKEVMEKLGISRDVKIFATDIDRDAIITAGAGMYPESIIGDLSPKVAAKYFYHKADKLQVTRHLREMVVFAQHNLIKDPPFTNIDLVTCRNLLIYLQPVLQRKAFEMFNFSLNSQGVLFLGTSETIGDMTDCFEPLHQKHKIYQSKGKSQQLHRDVAMTARDGSYPAPYTYGGRDRRRGDTEGNRIIKNYLEVASRHYLPLSVIVNERMEVIHFIGNTEGYFSLPSGPTDFTITKLAPKDLAIPLATGIQKVFRTGEEIVYTNARLQRKNEEVTIRIRILPFPEIRGQDPLATIFLEEIKRSTSDQAPTAAYDLGEEAQQRIKDLEQELQFARENLQATIEELETSNEELQATNEELLASNEELQSTNEELQSTNEELYTVNAEHQNKIIELTELNNDVDNLLTSSQIGTLMLDEDLEIRKFSAEIANVFHIMEKDIGRPLTHIAHRLVDFDPFAAVRTVQATNRPVEQEVGAANNQWYLIRILPYAIAPKIYSGVVLTLVDITETRTTQRHLADSQQTTLDISQFIPSGLFIYAENSRGELVLESTNPEAERITGIRAAEWAGKAFDEIWPEAGRLGLSSQFSEVMKTGKTCYLEAFHYQSEHFSGVFRIRAFLLADKRLAVSFEDVTERVKAQKALLESQQFTLAVMNSLASHVCVINEEGTIISVNEAWRMFAAAHPPIRGNSNEGANYLTICDQAEGADAETAQAFAAGIRDVLQGRIDQFSLEYPCHSDEEQRWFIGRVLRLKGYGNIHAVVVHENITERERMRQERENRDREYRNLFETMAQGVIYQDRAGRIISANPAAERILGLTGDQLKNVTSMDPRWRAVDEKGELLPGEQHPAMVALQTGEPVFGFIMGVHSPKFETPRWILVNATPQFHPGEADPYQVYTTFEDITERCRLFSAPAGPGCI